MIDLIFIDHGSIVLLISRSVPGRTFIEDNVEIPDWANPLSIPVEPRYVDDIINGATESGLTVEVRA